MSESSSPKNAAESGTPCAAVLSEGAEYAMFEATSVTGEGAILRGPLLLEVGEVLTLRLQRGDHKLEVRAEVIGVTDQRQLEVRFLDLGDADKAQLSSR